MDAQPYSRALVNDTLYLISTTAALATSRSSRRDHLAAKIRADTDRLLAALELVAPLVDNWANDTIKDWTSLVQASRTKVTGILESKALSNNGLVAPPANHTAGYLHLPDDILWQIAAHVRDRSTQCSMSLVSRAWNAATLPRLWTYISIRHPKYDVVCTRLFKLAVILQSNRRLGTLIREFECQTRSPEDLEDEVEVVVPDEISGGRFTHDLKLAKAVLSRIIQVEALHIQIEPLHIYDGFFDSETKHPTVRHLDLGSSLIDDTILQRIASCCPNVEEVFLRDCEEVSPAGFRYLVSVCPKIRVIGLNGCERLGDESVVALVDKCPQLEAIALGYRQSLSDTSITCLAKAPNIQALLLDGRDTLSEAPLLQLVQNRGAQLRTLDISFCDVSNHFAREMAAKCHRLESLALNGCKKELVTDEGIRAVLEGCRNLKVLSLEDNDGLSGDLLDEVIDRFGEDVPTITREFKYFRKWLR
ncbi:hypothetical protein HDV00_005782 [Rhizophlyctis rosea]|nr:hypothetical protein HDV00_005782 [Rhizophlyctis rosea]